VISEKDLLVFFRALALGLLSSFFHSLLRSNSLVIEARDTNLVVVLVGTLCSKHCLRFVFAPSLADSIIFLTLTRLVVVIILRISVSPYSPPSRRLSTLSKTDMLKYALLMWS
jgi:hypothetical protein